MSRDKLRIRFCPTCKSFNVRYIHKLRNLMGIIPVMKCLDCGAEMSSFPIMEVSRKELDKKNKEMEKKAEKLDKKILSENKNNGKVKIVCPKCKSEDVKSNMRYRGDTNMKCLDCGYENEIFLESKIGGKKK